MILFPRSHTIQIEDKRIYLTPTEYHLLEALVEHQGKVLSRAWLLNEVWAWQGDSFATRTIDAHAARLRKKLKEAGARCTVMNVHSIGYAFVDLGDVRHSGRHVALVEEAA